MALPQSGSSATDSRWNLEMLVFVEGGKPENPEKNPRSKDENQQQTQPTYDTGTGSQTRATLVRRALSPLRHPCSPIYLPLEIILEVKCLIRECKQTLKGLST